MGLNYTLKEPSKAQTWEKRGSQDLRVVLHNIYVKLLPLNLISSHNLYI